MIRLFSVNPAPRASTEDEFQACTVAQEARCRVDTAVPWAGMSSKQTADDSDIESTYIPVCHA